MDQQYFGALFSAGCFGTVLLGDAMDVRRITKNFNNMHPAVLLQDGSSALILSIHQHEGEAIKVTQNLRLHFLTMDKFKETGQLSATGNVEEDTVSVRSIGCQTDVSMFRKMEIPLKHYNVPNKRSSSASSDNDIKRTKLNSSEPTMTTTYFETPTYSSAVTTASPDPFDDTSSDDESEI